MSSLIVYPAKNGPRPTKGRVPHPASLAKGVRAYVDQTQVCASANAMGFQFTRSASIIPSGYRCFGAVSVGRAFLSADFEFMPGTEKTS